jgi:copper transport protein
MLKTSDGMFQIQFTVTPNHLGLNTFTVNVDDANSGKPATNLQVQLSTTMLEMAMGTDTLDLPSSGNGHYSTQGTLAMAGNWEIHMLLRTPDATLHEAQVQLSTQG